MISFYLKDLTDPIIRRLAETVSTYINSKKLLSGERFAILMESFLKTSPSKKQIEKYQESLLQEFENNITSEKVKESFEEKRFCISTPLLSK